MKAFASKEDQILRHVAELHKMTKTNVILQEK